ncbi:MAG: FHA domain-containing protein, partial [Acidimicrobiaceae bacterium]|nr:FHA domain-containing protein [Acidimicrobiaceae bacterium]
AAHGAGTGEAAPAEDSTRQPEAAAADATLHEPQAVAEGEGGPRPDDGAGEPPLEPIGIVDLRTAPTDSWTPLPPAEAGAPSPPGSPTVSGLRCPRGHFNHAGAVTCVNCGLPLDPIRGQGDGPRPVLGVLVGTDGTLWRVDSSYVLGTDPGSDPVVTSGQARPLVVADDGQAQAVHAELQANDWTFSVVDRSSRSGTFVLPPGQSDWQRVPPDQAVTVKPGTHVAVGSTVFTFTSPWSL